MKNYTGIWIVAHGNKDKVPTVTFELTGKARELADKFDEKVTAVIIGKDLNHSLKEPFFYGADEVIYVDEENLEEYDANSYANVLEKLINKYKPASVLFGADSIGRDLAPRIGVRLETGISADCIDLDMDYVNGKKLLLQKKPFLNGDVIVDILCEEKRPQISTVKPGMIPIGEPKKVKIGNIIRERMVVNTNEVFTRVIRSIDKNVSIKSIQDAEVIIAGGRGFKEKKDFDELHELADLLGGVVGATRPLVQEGWISETCQIGQSGKVVSPKLYIAFGISGAAQHTCGIVNPGTFIAVNSNPDAPIFNVADYGIVGDSKQVLRNLINILKQEELAS